MLSLNETIPADSITYLDQIQSLVYSSFHAESNKANKPLAKDDWRTLTDAGIMHSMIPVAFGGRDSHSELCDIIESVSRHNLPLGMYTMIVTALFIRNVSRYGTPKLKSEVLPIFSTEAVTGGFALTEPGCGSNLAKMKTIYRETDEGYIINGEKHWQAFSLSADWWLVAAKNTDQEKEFGYFIMKRDEGWKTVETYDALGLKTIDYGRSTIDAFIPKYRRLDITAAQLTGAVDMLCASRLSMCAMASGFLYRIYHEALTKTQSRPMGNGVLSDVDYVKYKLKVMLTGKIMARAMFRYLKEKTDFRADLTASFFEAQAIKTLSTDKMLECALIYQQLCGGEGYRYGAPDNTAAYALLDARVYTVFDGTNDLLNQQLMEYCSGLSTNGDVASFLHNYPKTAKGAAHFASSLYILNDSRTQAGKVLGGQIIARVFGLNCLEEYRDMISLDEYKNTVVILKAEVEKIRIDLNTLPALHFHR